MNTFVWVMFAFGCLGLMTFVVCAVGKLISIARKSRKTSGRWIED